MTLKIGDTVKTLIDKEPYYSGYGGNPWLAFPAGKIGKVGAVNVPKVRGRGTFICVDFVDVTGKKWRGSYDKGELKKL